jgi:heme/copper-type cytochrome/quinol oxidase subunit 2
MAGMRFWPKSSWAHAGIALVVATVLAIIGAGLEDQHSFAEAVRQYPHDGQDGLSALWDGMVAGFFIEVIVFVVLFMVQRRWLSSQDSN